MNSNALDFCSSQPLPASRPAQHFRRWQQPPQRRPGLIRRLSPHRHGPAGVTVHPSFNDVMPEPMREFRLTCRNAADHHAGAATALHPIPKDQPLAIRLCWLGDRRAQCHQGDFPALPLQLLPNRVSERSNVDCVRFRVNAPLAENVRPGVPQFVVECSPAVSRRRGNQDAFCRRLEMPVAQNAVADQIVYDSDGEGFAADLKLHGRSKVERGSNPRDPSSDNDVREDTELLPNIKREF